MVGHYSGTAKNYFFPATVDIFHSTISLVKASSHQDRAKSGVYAHRCGGTLVWPNNDNDKTNQVLTAAHCMCSLIGQTSFNDLPNHFFIRIGLLDNKRALNMTNFRRGEKPEAGTQYIDVRVKKIRYAGRFCPHFPSFDYKI